MSQIGIQNEDIVIEDTELQHFEMVENSNWLSQLILEKYNELTDENSDGKNYEETQEENEISVSSI